MYGDKSDLTMHGIQYIFSAEVVSESYCQEASTARLLG